MWRPTEGEQDWGLSSAEVTTGVKALDERPVEDRE